LLKGFVPIGQREKIFRLEVTLLLAGGDPHCSSGDKFDAGRFLGSFSGDHPEPRLIPEQHRAALKEVLTRNARAFGVGGQLGHVDTKVPVPLKPDTQPISLPMYGASPAKREVIDKQINAWFEAKVIEPSVSPWGFPCVVVYRNGKP
jgi:hypothetical protein